MTKNKLFILAITLALVFANSGVANAANPSFVPPPQQVMLNLKVTYSPLPVYPPLMVFTATLSPIPVPSPATALLVDFYLVQPDICKGQARLMDDPCDPAPLLIGSATVNKFGQAVMSKQLAPGDYTAFASVTIGGQTIKSNEFTFLVR